MEEFQGNQCFLVSHCSLFAITVVKPSSHYTQLIFVLFFYQGMVFYAFS